MNDKYQMLIDTQKRIEIKKAKERADAVSKYLKEAETFKHRYLDMIKEDFELKKFYASMPDIIPLKLTPMFLGSMTECDGIEGASCHRIAISLNGNFYGSVGSGVTRKHFLDANKMTTSEAIEYVKFIHMFESELEAYHVMLNDTIEKYCAAH